MSRLENLNWNTIHSFAVVAELRSLTKAAERLGTTQPTMSRHIEALEQQLSVTLFNRTASGLTLTEPGLALYEHARAMLDAARKFASAADGQTGSIAGTVRLTASTAFSQFMLPPILTNIRRLEPEIEIELVASDETQNLVEREADIAIRLVRPEQVDLIARKVGEFETGMFASKQYLEERGTPTSANDLFEHEVIGTENISGAIKGFRAAGLNIDRSFFAFRCESTAINWQMIKQGFGIGFGHLARGLADPDLVQLFPEWPLPSRPIWIAAHSEVNTNRRIRRVFDLLATSIPDYC